MSGLRNWPKREVAPRYPKSPRTLSRRMHGHLGRHVFLALSVVIKEATSDKYAEASGHFTMCCDRVLAEVIRLRKDLQKSDATDFRKSIESQ